MKTVILVLVATALPILPQEMAGTWQSGKRTFHLRHNGQGKVEVRMIIEGTEMVFHGAASCDSGLCDITGTAADRRITYKGKACLVEKPKFSTYGAMIRTGKSGRQLLYRAFGSMSGYIACDKDSVAGWEVDLAGGWVNR